MHTDKIPEIFNSLDCHKYCVKYNDNVSEDLHFCLTLLFSMLCVYFFFFFFFFFFF